MSLGGPIDDVTVVGAGPAGALAALMLARRGLRVRLLDRARFPRPKLCGDTLNPGALASLAHHLDLGTLRPLGVPLTGMRLSGPGGVTVTGRYPAGVSGLSVTRFVLDAWLLEEARQAGVTVEEGGHVRGPAIGNGTVHGVRIATAAGERDHRSRMVLGCDGRASVLARACGLAATPPSPRRWAFGAYVHDVRGVDPAFGEMHVRDGSYLGIAPVAGGLANVCLVLPRPRAAGAVARPWEAIREAVAADALLRDRFAAARLVSRPVVLGPVAVDVSRAGVPGMLLAGDASGFVDPMTGDGLRLAIDGAQLAAAMAADVLEGRLTADAAPAALAAARHRAFAAKWRFNRGLRALVDAPSLVRAATLAARAWPGAFEAMVRFAGDARLAA
ncbi:MAG: FAD-dependent monooxygenase [Acidobacteria bacterium]|nr:FAD-dependent monooxygenase [Acidobacteriota bacterium]